MIFLPFFPAFCFLKKFPTSVQVIEKVRNGLLVRLSLLLLGGSLLLFARWRIMGTGPPAFTEVDNPASFAENVFFRVRFFFFFVNVDVCFGFILVKVYLEAGCK